jgi:hypothetical protein
MMNDPNERVTEPASAPSEPADEETDDVRWRTPKWVALVTGSRLDPSRVVVPGPPPMTPAEFLTRRWALHRERRGIESRREAIDSELAVLEGEALRRRDLRRVLQEAEARDAPQVSHARPIEPLVRVRVRTQFATDHGHLIYYGNEGDCVDLPESLAARFSNRLEPVGPDVPLFRVQPITGPRQ